MIKTRTTIRMRPKCGESGCSNKTMWVKKYDDGTYQWRYNHGRFLCSTHHRHTHHPYLKHRKDYCENIDGRLGFKCTTNTFWLGMLDVDHKNGNPFDNRKKNLQTFCKCCHAYKTHKYKDSRTPGRKSTNQRKVK